MPYPYYSVNTVMNSGFRPETNRMVPVPGDPNYDRFWDEQRRREEEARRRSEERNPTTVPGGPTPDGGTGTGPAFPYSEWNTQQSDIEAAMQAFKYEDVFMNLLGKFGAQSDEMFDIYKGIMSQALDENGRVGADYAGASAAAQEMAGGASSLFFGGDAGRAGTFQNMVQQALGSVGQTGFSGTGVLQNSIMNATKQGGDIFTESYYQALPGLLNADVAMKTAYLQSADSGFKTLADEMNRSAENAFQANAWGVTLPFDRSGERQNREFQKTLEGPIRAALTPTPWLEQVAQAKGEDFIDYIFTPENIIKGGKWIWDTGKGWIQGGSGGDGGDYPDPFEDPTLGDPWEGYGDPGYGGMSPPPLYYGGYGGGYTGYSPTTFTGWGY